jgi:hypothetical protein
MDDKEGPKRKKRKGIRPYGASVARKPLLISTLLFLIILGLLIAEYLPRTTRFVVGKPSPETVISSRGFTVIDEEATEEAREAERERVMNLFLDQGARNEVLSRVGDFFNRLETAAQDGQAEDRIQELRGYLDDQTSQRLSDETLGYLLEAGEEERSQIFTATVELLADAMSHPVAPDNQEEVRDSLAEKSTSVDLAPQEKEVVVQLAQAFLRLNTGYSASVVESEMEAAAESVAPVYVRIEAGQKIVEKGEIITPLTLALLEEAGALAPSGTYQSMVAITLFAALLYAVIVLFFVRYRPGWGRDWRVILAVCLVLLVYSLLCRLFAVFADVNTLWGFLVPLALVGLTFSILLDRMVALFMVLTAGVLSGLLLKANFQLTLFVVLSGLLGALAIKEVRNRERIMLAGLEISPVIGLLALVTGALFRDVRFSLTAGAIGVGNGVLSILLTLGFLPVLERISGITTPMRLLELASPDHPLMRELITKAPGTYSHSIIVANMAEAAAREVGADPLLARVGAYYHDIGKSRRPGFFVENQAPGCNGHERLKPNLSALVIAAHVKDGVEMAEEYRLPREIVDIIRQHHGTSLIRYFYARALQERGSGDSVAESRFRYPGEKPQSKEAAIVMLADAIEAAAKAMAKPTPVKLEQLTRNLIRERLEDGQLSDSRLTLGDIEKIVQAFTRILSGMYHERVEYPVLVRGEGRVEGDG